MYAAPLHGPTLTAPAALRAQMLLGDAKKVCEQLSAKVASHYGDAK